MIANPTQDPTRSYRWDDGLLDLFSGLGIFLVGISWVMDAAYAGAIAPVLLASLWPVTRRRFITPRMNADIPSEGHGTGESGVLRTLLLGGVGVLVVGVAAYFVVTRLGVRNDWVSVALPALPATLLSLPAFYVASALRLPRFALYGIVFLAFGVVTVALDGGPGAAMMAGGGAMIPPGICLLSRFFRNHPAG